MAPVFNLQCLPPVMLNKSPAKLTQQAASGFTLIELVIGIALSATIFTFLSILFFSAPQRSIEPLYQIRAAEFGQALMSEILSKPYDETTPLGSTAPCNPCTAPAGLGADGEGRAAFDDVDDYDAYCGGSVVQNAAGVTPADFAGFTMNVCVVYDGDFDGGADDNNRIAKRIDLTITPPAPFNQAITFVAYRSNY